MVTVYLKSSQLLPFDFARHDLRIVNYINIVKSLILQLDSQTRQDIRFQNYSDCSIGLRAYLGHSSIAD